MCFSPRRPPVTSIEFLKVARAIDGFESTFSGSPTFGRDAYVTALVDQVIRTNTNGWQNPGVRDDVKINRIKKRRKNATVGLRDMRKVR